MKSILESIIRRPKIVFEKTHPKALLPKKSLEKDVGWDIFAVEDSVIPPKDSISIKSGLKVAHIDDGYWFKIESRSGLAFKHDIVSFQGIIDNNYRGELGLKLFNFSNKEYIIHSGDRVAQLVIYYENIDFSIEWGSVTPSNRGDKGFGSSGK
jgi:dUTP pyrophosphatase